MKSISLLLGFLMLTVGCLESKAANREVIGRWVDQAYPMHVEIAIFRKGKSLYLEYYFEGEKPFKMKMVETRKNRFEEVNKTNFGDFYIIDSSGNLELWDSQGLIRTAKKID